MATVRQYATGLRARQVAIARKLGVDIRQGDMSARVRDLSLIALIAVVVKAIVDKGLITEAELLAAFDAARDDSYTPEPAEPPPPEP